MKLQLSQYGLAHTTVFLSGNVFVVTVILFVKMTFASTSVIVEQFRKGNPLFIVAFHFFSLFSFVLLVFSHSHTYYCFSRIFFQVIWLLFFP